MALSLSMPDVSLLLAVTSIVLLVTSELISPYYGTTSLKISKKRLRYSAFTTSILFLVTVGFKIASIIINV